MKTPDNTQIHFQNYDKAAIVASRNLTTEWHSHVSLQLTVSPHGELIRMDEEEGSNLSAGVLIASNYPHRLHTAEQCTLTLLVDPAHPHAHRLAHLVEKQPMRTLSPRKAQKIARILVSGMTTASTINLQEISDIVVRSSICECRPDQRIRRAASALDRVTTERISSQEIANSVCLSESRFLHLFKSEVGTNFRRYLLWKKLQRAINSLDGQGTLTDISIESGFSDSAHLSRTCKEMYGIAPSMIRLCYCGNPETKVGGNTSCILCEQISGASNNLAGI